ncbi:LuxR C-terminal-related transcriptional regulator [Streptomyces sp. NPDC051987]|uniref:LuxR C-terminal-related transcriptional regulator n=1 Tax=Streptomyces sp. NPDC051987 TaxID=3155808 RepID=UPI00343126A2
MSEIDADTAFVDRADQLTVLHTALAQADRGRGRTVLVAAALAGGKTELLKTFGAYVESTGRTVLTATGTRAEHGLPLGLMDQLFRTAALPEDITLKARAILRAEALPAHEDGEAVPPEARALGTLLLELADRDGPVVIGIDDVHFADDASAQTVLYLSRRLARARILLVLTEPALPPTSYLPLRSRLAQLPHETLTLPALSPDGVAALLGARRPALPSVAEHIHRMTGGSPALVRGLAYDNPEAAPDETRVFGSAYRRAVLSCLQRGEPEMLRVARAVAVLGEHTDIDLTASVAEVPRPLVAPILRALEDAGLLADGRFRHEQGAAAVIEATSEQERTRVRLRAADGLQERGAAPAEVCRHLIDAGATPGTWAIEVLRQVAQEAMADDDTELALAALELAVAESGDEPTRQAMLQHLACALWRGNPAMADLRLEPLRQALREGRLAPENGAMLVRSLLWHGRFEQYDVLCSECWPPSNPRVLTAGVISAGMNAVDLGLSYLWIHGPRETNPFSDIAQQISDHDGGTWMQSAISAGPAFFRDPTTAPCDFADVPDSLALGDSTPEAIAYMVTGMLHADQVELADRWCTALVAEAEKRAAPTWQALLSAAHADVLLRTGDLERSAALAESALGLLSPLSWGVVITFPLAVLTTANTALGRHDHNERLLRRYRVPPAAGTTLLGLRYVRARGHHRLAGGAPLKALADFDQCGFQARAAGIDLPELLPWRTDLSQVRLRLGETADARQLAEEELELCRLPRSRGIATRVLAACADLRARPRLLQDAVDLLQESGDRLEVAHAISDLARAYEELGDLSRARILVRSAGKHAPSYTEPARTAAALPQTGSGVSVLSDAELRVARLAARGHTNREISRRLSITISTVEQHITRIYRKLDIKVRAELPERLFSAGGI